jgi:hypothetical protein
MVLACRINFSTDTDNLVPVRCFYLVGWDLAMKKANIENPADYGGLTIVGGVPIGSSRIIISA